MGEPLLDKTLPEKIALAKDKGFKGIGFATNATHLTPETTEDLLDSGLDTIIFSIDGITKSTHEHIRSGVDFDQIMQNVLHFVERRNARGLNSTKVIVRMIRQESNHHEWNEYKTFWNDHLNPEFGDQVSVFDVHNWGVRQERERERRDKRFSRLHALSKKTKMICPDLLDRMWVYIDGGVALCCGDEKGVHNLGNVFYQDPVSIYNGPKISKYRQIMSEGRLTDIAYCKNCQIIISRMEKQYLDITKKS
jgi:MoaA/NifB/PqqE/SkfB family radical SAM enzyme